MGSVFVVGNHGRVSMDDSRQADRVEVGKIEMGLDPEARYAARRQILLLEEIVMIFEILYFVVLGIFLLLLYIVFSGGHEK